MFPIRGTCGLVAVVALTFLAVAPAFAKSKKPTHYTAKLDCGAGTVIVDTGNDVFAPLVQRKTGRVYYPVAFKVKVRGEVRKLTKRGYHGRTLKCTYDDGVARGSVWVKAPKRSAHRKR